MRAVAADWVEELAPFATATGWPWAMQTLDLGRPLVADQAEAAWRLERSLARRRRTPDPSEADRMRPYDEARSLLAYGEWLRRDLQRVESPPHLRAALATLRRAVRQGGRRPVLDLARHRGVPLPNDMPVTSTPA